MNIVNCRLPYWISLLELFKKMSTSILRKRLSKGMRLWHRWLSFFLWLSKYQMWAPFSRKSIILAHLNTSKLIGMQFSCIVLFHYMINIESFCVKHSLLLLNLSTLKLNITMISGILPFFTSFQYHDNKTTAHILQPGICTCKIIDQPHKSYEWYLSCV